MFTIKDFDFLKELNSAITVTDENLNIIYRSPLLEKITGYTPGEIHGNNIFELVHPQDKDLIHDFINEIKSKQGHPIPISFRLKLKNGKTEQLELGFLLFH